MTQKIINIGTADKGNGDPLRTAFTKVNENFTELYTALGLNADGTLNLGAFEFTDSVMSTTDSSAITIDQAVTVTSDLTVGGNILPQTANGGDLGSLARPWKTLYVSNQTIYLGSVPLSLDANNNLTVNGSPVAGASLPGWTVDLNNHFLPNTDILQDIGTPANRVRHIYIGPGSITIGSSVITESSTGKLVLPGITRGVNYTIDEVEEKGDQNYEFDETPLVIDAAYYDILRGVLNTPQGYQPPEYAVDDMDDGEIDGISVVSQGAGLDQTVANKMRERMRAYVGNNQDPINNFVANDWIVIPFTVSTEAADIEYETGANTGNFTFDADTITNSNGMTLVTDRGSLVIGTNMEVPGVAGHFHIAIDASNAMPPAGDLFLGDDYNYVKLPGSELNPNAEYGVEIGAHDRDSMDNSHVWRFNTDGGLTFPQGTFLGYSDPGGFIIDGAVDKDIAIYTYSGADAHGWTFGEDGDLTLPAGGDILDSEGNSVLGGGSGSSTVVRQDTPPSADNGTLWFNTLEGRLYIKYSDAWIDAAPLMTPAPDTDIDVASITFPDASVQTTAFTGTALTDRLVNGVNELVLESDGSLEIPGNITGNNDINITVDSGDSSSYTWNFGQTGNLTLPNGMSIDSYGTSGVNAFLEIGGDDTSIGIDNDGAPPGLTITTNGTGGMAQRQWRFDPDGDLTLPAGGDILDSQGNSVLGGGDDNIWVQTFVSNDPAVDFPNIATSVEYDSEGNVIALFVHTIDLTGERYFTVGKYTAAGTKIWTARLSDDTTTDGWGLAVDNAGGWIYVAGAVDGVGYPYQQATLTKIDAATGGVEWYRIYDFGYDSNSAVVDVDSDGHPVMVGYVDLEPSEFGVESYLAITKVNKTTGAVTWSRKLDGQADEQAYGMAVGPTGEVVAVGYMDQLTGVDTDDRMVAVKYLSDGTIAWQKAIQFDEGWDCTGADADIDSQGNIYICGEYTFEFNGGPGTGSAIGIVKLDSSGVKQWSRRVVGDCISLASSIVVGPDDKLYISGITGNEVENIAFKWLVAKFDFDGLVEWQRFIENTGTWTFSGQFFNGDGGGSNLAVRQGYVALAGGFGNIEAEEQPMAAVLQVSSTGNVFSVGNWNFTSASLSSTLNSTASDITVINAGLTDTDNASAITSSVVGITTEVGNFLIGTVLTAPGGNDSLVNGAYSVSLSNTGVVTLPAGGTITEGYVTSNPTIQLTPATPTVASQKLVIKGGGGYINIENGITVVVDHILRTEGSTITVYVESVVNADQTLYWWTNPSTANGGVGGTVALDEFGDGSFSFTVDNADYEFKVRVSPEDNNYGPGVIGAQSVLINGDDPTFSDDHHLHLTTGNLTETSIFLGTDDHNVRTTTDGGIEITTPNTTNNVWQFGTDGSLTLPIGVSIDSSVSALYPKIIADSGKLFSVQGQGSTGSAAMAWSLNPNTDTQYAAVGVNKGGGDDLAKVVLTAGNTTATLKVWKFDETGVLTFPISSESSAFTLGTDFTQTIVGDFGNGTGYIRVESNDGPPNFNSVNISTNFYNFLTTLTAGTEFTVNTVVDGTTYNTVVAFTEFAGGNPASTGRNDLYYTYVSGDTLPFSYSATELTLTFTTNSNGLVIAPTSITFPDGTIQTTAAAPAFGFSVAADDSTQRAVSNNESIKFIGAGGVTTASDAEGNITITGGGGSSIPAVVTTGAVGVNGAAHAKVQFTVASATEVTAVGVTVIGVTDSTKGTITLAGSPGTGSFDVVAVTNTFPGEFYILMPFATNASGTGYGAPISGEGTNPCLVRGTMITMADMSRVAVENISYSDDILVWDFDLGEFASAKPLWIKKTQTSVVSCLLTFSDHSELRIVGESPKAHRIFNKEAGKFTYGSMPETPIGTTTFNDQGEEITLISKEWIVGEVEFYNVMTDYHMNLFANSILTSMRYNNLYPITDMKFVKDSRTLRTADDYTNIEERLFRGFRLAEQTQSVEEIETHIQWLLSLEVERETECV